MLCSDNSRKNEWDKVKKSSKIGKDQKALMSSSV